MTFTLVRRSGRGALWGFALLITLPVLADVPLREAVRDEFPDENYLLVEYHDGARLYVFSSGSTATLARQEPGGASAGPVEKALEMTRSADSRTRVRGLTLLSGIDDPVALDTALVLLSDPIAAVREEAVHLALEHADADISGVAAIASRDPSPRVREAGTELIGERLDDGQD